VSGIPSGAFEACRRGDRVRRRRKSAASNGVGTDGPRGKGNQLAGRKARTGRASGDRGEGQRLIDTLRVIDAGYTQHRIEKAASGGSATAFPRSLETSPRELKTQEGIRVTAGLKAPSDTADSGLEQDPEVDATFAGAGQPAGGGANGARVAATERWYGQAGGGNPWSENPGHGSAAK
jgi:hypothetical protein